LDVLFYHKLRGNATLFYEKRPFIPQIPRDLPQKGIAGTQADDHIDAS
jgi:hypothetical protein